MNNPRRHLMLWITGLAALTLCATSALADPITLQANTTGAFGAGSSGATVSNGNTTLTATAGGTSSTINFPANSAQFRVALNPGEVTNITLGTFETTSNSTLPLLSGPNFTGATFTLTITFTVPGDLAPQTFNANLRGQIIQTASSAQVQWTSPTTLTFVSPTVGTIRLTIEPTTDINPPGAGGANPPSEIRARIELVQGTVVIPEPATLILLGSGLAGLAAAGRKSRRNKGAQ
jgi:hypothetical protein